MKSLQILTSLHSSVRSSIDFLSHSTANQMCEWLLWVYCLTIKPSQLKYSVNEFVSCINAICLPVFIFRRVVGVVPPSLTRYTLMHSCWKEKPGKRPTAQGVVKASGDIMKSRKPSH